MKEDFLHFLWKYKLFNLNRLKTVQGEDVVVLRTGVLNTNSGPDFFNAQLKINKQHWVGTVEIHVKSSDWYVHQHEIDANYDTVILHVVWEYDTDVFMKNNQPLPTLVLKDYIEGGVLDNYYKLFNKNIRWIPCEQQIAEVDSFLLNNWLERLYFERLEHKSILINDLLKKSNNDFEAVLFQLLVKNFGLKVNGEAFLQLAQSFDFYVLRKVRFEESSLSALIFGQAGFLEEKLEEEYFFNLKEEYEYLKHKFQLNSMLKNSFQFFRMRPANFPTIRLAQLVSLYHKNVNLFSDIMNLRRIEDIYTYFSLGVNDFWKTHYTFEATSKKSPKRLTKSFVDLLIINTIIPLKFVWQKRQGKEANEELLYLLKEVKPEKNSIISKFSDLNITSKNAFETQALLELKNNYCTSKKCLQCEIGNNLLRK